MGYFFCFWVVRVLYTVGVAKEKSLRHNLRSTLCYEHDCGAVLRYCWGVVMMVMVKFKENGRCGVFNLEQIKIRPCGKVVAPFGLVQLRECEIIEYIK
ncbi:hypothetical protein [Salmonella phage ZBSTP8]|nr:hypothetical protein [Salmonella phage ZBSTP8]